MHFRPIIIFLAAISINFCCAFSQKPLVLNAVSSTPYNPITTLPKQSHKPPVVLNPMREKAWDRDFQVFSYDSGFHRAGTLMLGLSELAIGIPGFLLVALVSGCVGGAPLKPIDRFHLSVYQLSGAFFTGRTTYAGFVNTYNGIAQDHKQITMHTKTRMALGLAELSGWLLMVLCTIASPSVSNHTRFKFKDLIEGLIIAPQLWGLAIAGAYDVLRASSEMNNGVTIARF